MATQTDVRKELAAEATDAFLLWLDNEAVLSGSAVELARQCRDGAPYWDSVLDGTWTPEQAEVYTLADKLKHRIEWREDIDGAQGLVAALIRPTLERIDWNDVARHYLTKLDEGA